MKNSPLELYLCSFDDDVFCSQQVSVNSHGVEVRKWK